MYDQSTLFATIYICDRNLRLTIVGHRHRTIGGLSTDATAVHDKKYFTCQINRTNLTLAVTQSPRVVKIVGRFHFRFLDLVKCFIVATDSHLENTFFATYIAAQIYVNKKVNRLG